MSAAPDYAASPGRTTRAATRYDFKLPAIERPQIAWGKSALSGYELLRNPFYNKGLGFTWTERRDLNLHGLLPPHYRNLEVQAKMVMTNIRNMKDNLAKYQYFMSILDSNEKLFFRVLCENITEVMPIVYTPTVGLACQKYGLVYNPRGLFITIRDRGRVFNILNNWPFDNIQAICVTDGERILGLGDLGCHGMGIPVGKLALYTGCAGVKPYRLLPITLDCGTKNKALRESELYVGLKQERVRGEEYDKLIDEFMKAVTARWGPTTLIQFEDFGNSNAFRLLEKYRDQYCTFNDDIQGTASVAVAGLLTSLRVDGAIKDLSQHTILMFGAGSAGVGIADLICYAMSRGGTMTIEEARKHIWLVDSTGLVYGGRKSGRMDALKLRYAHDGWDKGDCKDLATIIAEIKATAILGVSGQPQTFTKKVCEAVLKNNPRPIIFPMSNPTSKAECTAEQAYGWTKGACVFASGSPFPPQTIGGKTFVPAQGNNAYVFPGMALGIIASKTRRVTEDMFLTAADTVSSMISEEQLKTGTVFPKLDRIREVSFRVAVETARLAFKSGLATEVEPENIEELIKSNQYDHRVQRFYHDTVFDSLERDFAD